MLLLSSSNKNWTGAISPQAPFPDACGGARAGALASPLDRPHSPTSKASNDVLGNIEEIPSQTQPMGSGTLSVFRPNARPRKHPQNQAPTTGIIYLYIIFHTWSIIECLGIWVGPESHLARFIHHMGPGGHFSCMKELRRYTNRI